MGKSTLVNNLVGKTKTKVGNEPAVTRGQPRIHLKDNLYLLDTPGMLWPKIGNENSAYRLTISGAITETAFDYGDIAIDVIKDDSKLVKSLDYQVGIEPAHHSNSKDASRDAKAAERRSGNQIQIISLLLSYPIKIPPLY